MLAIAMWATVVMSQPSVATVHLPRGGVVNMEMRGNMLRATASEAAPAISRRTLTVDSSFRKAVRGATEVIAIGARAFTDGDRSYFVLAVATPSVDRPGIGFCGAGTEDQLLLIEWQDRPRRLVLRDQMEIQSCLKSIVLRSDQGSDLPTLVAQLNDPAHIHLTWLEHPTFHEAARTVSARDGKFVVIE